MLNSFLEAEFKPTGLDYQVISALGRASRKVRLFKMLLTLTLFQKFLTIFPTLEPGPDLERSLQIMLVFVARYLNRSKPTQVSGHKLDVQ